MRSAHEVDGLAAPLATASAPRRLISLELVRSCTEVGRITGEWHDHRLASPDRNAVDAARDALDADDRLVVAYSLTFAIAAFLALWRAGAPWWAVGLAVAAALVAGVCDLRENGGIREMLLHPGDVAACRAGALAARTRTFAQVKFTLLLGVGIATLVGFGTWLRNWMTGGWRRTETGPSRTFADLIVKELHDVATDDEQWAPKFKVLKENIEHHIQEEEGPMFRTARGVMPADRLELLGARMAKMKADAEAGR